MKGYNYLQHHLQCQLEHQLQHHFKQLINPILTPYFIWGEALFLSLIRADN